MFKQISVPNIAGNKCVLDMGLELLQSLFEMQCDKKVQEGVKHLLDRSLPGLGIFESFLEYMGVSKQMVPIMESVFAITFIVQAIRTRNEESLVDFKVGTFIASIDMLVKSCGRFHLTKKLMKSKFI